MKKYKGGSVLFCILFFAIFFLSMPVPSQASFIGFETLEYTNEEEKSCNLQEELGQAVGGKWWEAPLTAILDASVAVGENTFNSVARGAEKLMFVGLGLWLAVFTLKIVGGMQESDPMDNLTKIGGMIFKGGIASALLLNSNFFFSYFFAPIVQAGAAFVNIGPSVSIGSGSGLSEVAAALKQMADGIHDSTAQMIGRADFLSCIMNIHIFQIMGKTIFTLQDPGGWTTACMIRIGAFFFLAAFPFFLMDACFRMGVTAALCPLFIVAWVFPSTADFAKKGLNSVLNLAFTFMMLKISMDMAVQLLIAATGIGGIAQDKESQKKYVCLFKWAHLGGGEDPCMSGGEPVYEDEGSNVLVFIVCVVYGLMLMKSAGQLANYFADTSFKNDAAFQAAKGTGRMMGSGIKYGVKAAGAAQDRVALHNDRAAARTVEKDRRAREDAKNNNRPYTPPTGKAAKRLDKAKQRLQRNGALKADGSETQKYAELLKNGKARTLLNGLTMGKGFKDQSWSYKGLRGAAQAQSLDSVSTTLQRDAKTSSDWASVAQQRFDHAPSDRYDKALVGQKQFDKDMVAHAQNKAQYQQKLAANPAYSASIQGRTEYASLMNEERDLNKRQKKGGFDDYIRTGIQPKGYGYNWSSSYSGGSSSGGSGASSGGAGRSSGSSSGSSGGSSGGSK